MTPHRPWQARRLARRRRLRRWLRRLPRRATVGRYPVIRRFADAARARPWLWSFRHREVMVSIYAGSVLALLPTYGFQLLLGFALAVWLRGNLTVMTALQMVVNPLTIAPIYAGTWALGSWLAGAAGVDLGDGGDPRTHAAALVIGGIVAGLGFALVLDVLWRIGAWEAAVFRERVRAEAGGAFESEGK
ncbi:DUF2062 domain-containing protein [Arenimonas composti]|uniref:DUF2062 domain-containing protein n=1 Tax=Arenimonas composti TR7-09 = DSM 18010 TaxID=1121013 RepID=A0A091BFF0_9GAMM|nr:DUF2062 domain-containing protein [Arenimonas composti]KFN49529.1 hypothetical protein P873_10270 [Arenimonas composti TR7-09 = DSM 18010]